MCTTHVEVMASFIFRRCSHFSENFYRGRILRASRFMNSFHEHDEVINTQVCGQSCDTVSPEAPPPPLEEQCLLKAAVIGTPNVGKSTLVNQLLGAKLFAVSPKVHTTIRKAMAVFTEKNTQVVLLDTPGIVPYQYGRKLHLPKNFLTDPAHSLLEADLIMVMVDAANKKTREQIHPEIIAFLKQFSHLPAVLVLNKVDAVKQKHILLFVAEALTGSRDETQSKMRQLRALRGKIRDGTIRGKRARHAAMLEVEKLKKELNITGDQETTSKMEKRSLKSDRRLPDSEDELVQSTKESSAVDGMLPDANTEHRHNMDAIGSTQNKANDRQEKVLAENLSSNSDKLLSNSKIQSSHNEATKEPPSDTVPSSPDSLCEDETLSSGQGHIATCTSGSLDKRSSQSLSKSERLSTPSRNTDEATLSWPHFEKIFMISALTGDGIDELKSYILTSAKARPWEYLSTDMTDQSSLHLVEDIIREKLFHHYDLELPYVTRQENVLWEWNEDETELTIYQNLVCQKPSQASILIGPRGDTIQMLTAEARDDIERLLKCTVDLTIYVKSAKKK